MKGTLVDTSVLVDVIGGDPNWEEWSTDAIILAMARGPVYVNQIILAEVAGGKTYSQLSTLSRQNPNDEALAGQVQTAFRGETLRGLLLNAYAFGTMATVAFVAAWVALGTGAALIVLAALGFLHARRASGDVHIPGWHPEKVTS